jgi:parallel beta-helix repeat protein
MVPLDCFMDGAARGGAALLGAGALTRPIATSGATDRPRAIHLAGAGVQRLGTGPVVRQRRDNCVLINRSRTIAGNDIGRGIGPISRTLECHLQVTWMSHFPATKPFKCTGGLACGYTVGPGDCIVPPASCAFGVRGHTKPAPIARLAAGVAVAVIGALFASASADASMGHAAFIAPPGTMPRVTPVTAQPPTGAVLIGVDSLAQSVVDSHPSGTAFVISSGVHVKFSVIPRAGDRFFAQRGAVLDGQRSVLCAFRVPPGGTANGVQVIGASRSDPLVVENYGMSAHSQVGAIQTNTQTVTPALYSTGWRLQWVKVTGSSSRGISLSDHMVVLGCQFVGNGRLGIGGGGVGITIAYSTVDDNGLTVGHRGWEAGGIKTIAHNVLIEHNVIRNNGAPGIWTDGGASDVVIYGNLISGNRFGVHIEISTGVTLTSNSITTSQQQAVLIIASSSVMVQRNSIDNNFGGVIVGGVGRVGPDGVHLDRVHVMDNSIIDSGATGLHQTVPSGATVDFDGDHIIGGHLQWDGHGIKIAELQSLGQEVHGSWVK